MKAFLILGLVGLVASANASVLTFDIDGLAGSGALMPQDYGDNITAADMGNNHYGIANGLTPNVTVSYLGSPGGQADCNWWATGYNDLTNVLEYEPDGWPEFSFTLTADAGFNVNLASFDFGNFGGAVTLPGLTVTDENNNVLYSVTNYAVGANTGPHQNFNFGTGLVGQSLTVRLDLTGLGNNSDNMGLDNIAFTQNATSVPEPTSLAVLGLGVFFLRRRKN